MIYQIADQFFVPTINVESRILVSNFNTSCIDGADTSFSNVNPPFSKKNFACLSLLSIASLFSSVVYRIIEYIGD